MKFGKENGRYNMCIAIPGKMTAIVDENTATIDMGGICRDVNMALMEVPRNP